MEANGVIVDTHLWIEFFSGKANVASTEIARLIKDRRIRLAGPVLYELLVGPRVEGQRQYLQSQLRAFALLDTTETVWLRAIALGRLHAVFARQVPPSDVLIAAHCAVHGCALFTRDSHFDAFPELKRHRIRSH